MRVTAQQTRGIMKQELIINTTPAAEDCRWCSVRAGEPHSFACPCGDRYAQIQKLGGVPFVQEVR